MTNHCAKVEDQVKYTCMDRHRNKHYSEIWLDFNKLQPLIIFLFFFFFFYEWEHRTGTMCPFSSLHPLRNEKDRQ